MRTLLQLWNAYWDVGKQQTLQEKYPFVERTAIQRRGDDTPVLLCAPTTVEKHDES